jgi:hypothetical protein
MSATMILRDHHPGEASTKVGLGDNSNTYKYKNCLDMDGDANAILETAKWDKYH